MRGKSTVEVAASTVFLFLASILALMALLHSAELIHLTTGHSESNAKVLTYKIIRCLVDKMYGCQQLCCKYVRLSLCIYLIWDSLSRGRMSISHRFFSMKHIMAP